MHSEQARRRHPRVSAGFLVKIHTGGRCVVAKARDLSMTGLQLASEPADLGDRVVVEIPLPREQREVVLEGHVVRSESGCAVHFLDLDLDDMFALARFLAPRLP